MDWLQNRFKPEFSARKGRAPAGSPRALSRIFSRVSYAAPGLPRPHSLAERTLARLFEEGFSSLQLRSGCGRRG